MKLEDITHIKQTKNEKEVNEYLSKEYKIVKILSSKVSTEFGDEVTPVFVLALFKK